MEQLIIFAVLISLGYIAGSIQESRHYKSIKKREKEYMSLPVVNIKNALDGKAEVKSAELVYGSAVISIDYFKRALASLRNIFGGEMISYETLVDRARREAILRMKEMAKGVDIILNVRIETSSIGQSANKRKSLGSLEVLAYGTAVTLSPTLHKNGNAGTRPGT